MKVLIITRMKDIILSLPPEVMLELNQGAAAFVDKYRNLGKIEVVYNIPGNNMSASILNLESAQEMDDLFLEFPFTPFMNFEIYVLSDFDANMKKMIESTKKMLESTT